eukprot:365776-Chlamydomonas_euryale.AAC.16
MLTILDIHTLERPVVSMTNEGLGCAQAILIQPVTDVKAMVPGAARYAYKAHSTVEHLVLTHNEFVLTSPRTRMDVTRMAQVARYKDAP